MRGSSNSGDSDFCTSYILFFLILSERRISGMVEASKAVRRRGQSTYAITVVPGKLFRGLLSPMMQALAELDRLPHGVLVRTI